MNLLRKDIGSIASRIQLGVMEPLERGCAAAVCKCDAWRHEQTAKTIAELLNESGRPRRGS